MAASCAEPLSAPPTTTTILASSHAAISWYAAFSFAAAWLAAAVCTPRTLLSGRLDSTQLGRLPRI